MSDRHNYYRPSPVDFLLLDLMPEVGTIGGVHWKGRRAKDMREDIIDRTNIDPMLLPTSHVNARLRSMRAAGLVEPFPGGKGSAIWAKTPKGVQYRNENKEMPR